MSEKNKKKNKNAHTSEFVCDGYVERSRREALSKSAPEGTVVPTKKELRAALRKKG